LGKRKKKKKVVVNDANRAEIEARHYTTPELAKLLNVPLRKALSYLERGYIRASVQEADGHGSRRLFTFDDVLKAKVIQYCEKMGLAVPMLRKISGKVVVKSERGSLTVKVFDVYPGGEVSPLDFDPDELEYLGAMTGPGFEEDEAAPAVLRVSVNRIREQLMKDIAEKLP